ncbi:isoaspartyl peptidase/L-asparaginase [Phormidium tenue FACHB-886]|nr:isoaspartyl peptidase/L-asparaginase [Phormidium tenue FACHB-886]
MVALIVHGGCGIWLPYAQEIAISGCRDAVVKGGELLRCGGSALDAAIAACVVLEDNPVFNAGTGSVLNYDGEAQMDASLMEGHTLRFGAVAAIERVKNPVLVAKKVIEETDHNILIGAGAVAFARQVGFPDHNPCTSERIAEHHMLRAKVPQGELRISRFSAGHPEHAHSATTGTVGAVALDSQGNLAAATSTGGIALKLSGRVGDTPLPGCGTYATAYGAASSTGTGEFVMRILGSRQVCDLIESGHTAQTAVERTLQQIQTSFAAQTGLIAIDRTGNLGIAHRTPEMPHAFFSSDSTITARIRI